MERDFNINIYCDICLGMENHTLDILDYMVMECVIYN